jgi:hypothetical protein
MRLRVISREEVADSSPFKADSTIPILKKCVRSLTDGATMTNQQSGTFASGVCLGFGAAMLLLHVAAWVGTAVVLSEWLRITAGIVGLALLTVSHFLRMNALANTPTEFSQPKSSH